MTETSEPAYITPKEFLARNAGRISKDMLYRYIAAGLIPAFQPFGKGGKILVPEDALSRVMQERQQQAGVRE